MPLRGRWRTRTLIRLRGAYHRGAHWSHIGVDATSGLVHTAGVTTGSVHDAKVMDNLIREDDRAVYGDKDMPTTANNDRRKQRAFCGP